MSSDPWKKLSLYLTSLVFCLLCLTVNFGFLWPLTRLEATLSCQLLGAWEEKKRKVLISRCTTSGQHLCSVWTKWMKGERNSYWWEGNRWQSTAASLRPASGPCSPLFASFKGYTPHSHQGSQGVDSLAGNLRPAPGRISRGLPMGCPPRSRRGASAHSENRAGPGQQAPDYTSAPHVPSGWAGPVSLWNQRQPSPHQDSGPARLFTVQPGCWGPSGGCCKRACSRELSLPQVVLERCMLWTLALHLLLFLSFCHFWTSREWCRGSPPTPGIQVDTPVSMMPQDKHSTQLPRGLEEVWDIFSILIPTKTSWGTSWVSCIIVFEFSLLLSVWYPPEVLHCFVSNLILSLKWGIVGLLLNQDWISHRFRKKKLSYSITSIAWHAEVLSKTLLLTQVGSPPKLGATKKFIYKIFFT